MQVVSKWADIQKHYSPLTEAEEALKNACLSGETCQLGDEGDLPPFGPPSTHRHVRAAVLRYFIAGGCKDCTVSGPGVQLYGAHIVEQLNLDFIRAKGSTELRNCVFDQEIKALQADFRKIDFSGSRFPGVLADGTNVNGHILIRSAISYGDVRFSNATVGGQFSLIGSKLYSDMESRLRLLKAKVLDGTITEADANTLQDSTNSALNLSGSTITGGVFLNAATKRAQKRIRQKNSAFVSKGTANLFRAQIGALYAEGVVIKARDIQFETQNDPATEDTVSWTDAKALRASGLIVEGPVRLNDTKASGEIDFEGAQIKGSLELEDTQISNKNGHSFNGKRMRVHQALVWKEVDHKAGNVSFAGAHVSELDDDPKAWPSKNVLHLDGFTYDRIKGVVSISNARDEWLERGSYFEDGFRPQPYTHYAKFLRNTGHDDRARGVLLQRERLVKEQQRGELSDFVWAWRWFWDGLQDLVVGYGHAPFRSIWCLVLLIMFTWYPAAGAWDEGSMAPNSGPILVSHDWQWEVRKADKAKANGEKTNPAEAWGKSIPGKDWESFNAFAYAVDVVIPIINFGQTDAWAPSTEREDWGRFLWWWQWVMTTLGWIVTALGAAAITGIIRQD